MDANEAKRVFRQALSRSQEWNDRGQSVTFSSRPQGRPVGLTLPINTQHAELGIRGPPPQIRYTKRKVSSRATDDGRLHEAIMTSWENPVPVAVHLSSSDLETRSFSEDVRDIPLIDDARSRTFDAVCTQLTTNKWMERWRGMCVISSEPDGERSEGSELRAETWRAHPSFELGEVTMTRPGNVHFLTSLKSGCVC